MRFAPTDKMPVYSEPDHFECMGDPRFTVGNITAEQRKVTFRDLRKLMAAPTAS